MATEIKKFLDQGGVSTLWSKVAEKIAAEEARAKAAEEATAAAAKKAQDDVDALEGYVGTFTASEGVDTVVKYIDAKTANIASDETVSALADRVTQAENDIDAIEADYLKAADKTELSNAIAAEATRATGVEAGLRTDVDVIKGDYLKAADKEALQTQINTILNNPDAEGVINSINEFTQYIADHGEIAEGFRTDIDANAKAIEDHEALAAQTYETKTDAAQKLTDAKAYTDTEVAKDRARLDALELIDHDHTNKTVLDGITAEKVAAWDASEQNAKDYADGLAGNYDAAGSAADAEQNAKNYADSLAGNYDAFGSANTAEQNAKDYADGLYNAIQALTTEDIEAAIAQATV